MGFFDRFAAKKNEPSTPATPAAPSEPVATTGGGVMAQLVQARECLEAKDLPGAMALYETVLGAAGDRADVLVTISADLGLNGRYAEIVELVAPRYDAERHGPATGLNLLQAYLALHQADAAQHVLDILFSLQRPELEDRLHGFSNAIAELLVANPSPIDPPGGPDAPPPEAPKINFVSISKPIWFYGLEPMAEAVLPAKGAKLRRIAFTQLALVGVPALDEVMQKPEDETGRLTRALPLWFAETFYFSPHYSPIAVIGVMSEKHHVLLGVEWSLENLKQLAETTDGGLDYIFTGAVRRTAGGGELILRLWEVRKMKERKTFNATWTDATADQDFAKLHEQVRMFMEWSAEKSGLPYVAPKQATTWLNTLGASLSLFLAGKGLLPKEQLAVSERLLNASAAQAAESDAAALAWLTLQRGATQQGVGSATVPVSLPNSSVVTQARALVG